MNKVRTVVQSWKHYWGELKHKRNEEGLTLIELMVVVVILGIISAVAIPSISSAINSAKVSTTESDLATLQQSLQRYYIDHNNYPATLGLIADQTNSSGVISTGTGSFGPYVDIAFPENDAWSHSISYVPVNFNSVTGTGYILLSVGNSSATVPTTGSTFSWTANAGEIVAAGGQGVTPETPTTISASAPTPLQSGGTAGTWSQQ